MIDVQLCGRLGNQMFEYAVARSVAEKNGYNFYIPPDLWLGDGLFTCDMGVKDGETTNWFHDKENQPFQPDIFNVPDFTNLIGFFQSEKYFNRDDVKKWFSYSITEKACDFVHEYPTNEYCYINVRGTDQAEYPHLVLPDSYYLQSISIMENFNPNLKFLVITDDIPLSKKYFPYFPVFSNDRDTDFCILGLGRFVISAISTFCWWACYLNDRNIVVAPRGWFASQLSDDLWQPQDIRTHKFIWI